MPDIHDFGEKIGGARKDLWSARGLGLEDLNEMNEAERRKYVKKDSVWKRPDYNKLMEQGMSPRVAYFIKSVRDSLPTGPYLMRSYSPESVALAQANYIRFVSGLRDAAMSLKQESDIAGFYERHIKTPYLTGRPGSYVYDVAPEAKGLIDRKVMSLKVMESLPRLDRAIKLKQFGYTSEQKLLDGIGFHQYDGETARFEDDRGRMHLRVSVPGGVSYGYPSGEAADPAAWEKGSWFAMRSGVVLGYNAPDAETLKQSILASYKEQGTPAHARRKTRFVPPQLAHIRFSGADFRHGRDMTGQDYLDSFRFRGGEFGNWMNEQDRQASLSMGYESLCAMAKALNLSLEDMSLGGKLAIAFGARGQGAAMAHYEPLREVINLTKMKGAGSLAHEWGHAMDDILNKELGANALTSERRRGLSDVQLRLQNHMKYVEKVQTPEEQKQAAQPQLERLERSVRQTAYSALPRPETLTPEQAKQMEKLVDAVLADRSICEASVLQTPASIEALSSWKRELVGRVISKADRDAMTYIMGRLNRLKTQLEQAEPATVRLPSRYMEESKRFDDEYSKDGHGYWSSDCEMFARAFACYTHDKLREAGITCDYAVGHAEAGPVPRGEERQALNHEFDQLLDMFRERGLLHEYVEPEISREPEGEREAPEPWLEEATFEQMSLDDLMRDASSRAGTPVPVQGRERER